MANLTDIAALGTTPIPGDSPTGASARYEPDYEKVQLEIEKLQSVSQTPVEWGQVVSLCSTLLTSKTKDLLIASYLTTALLVENGYPGLAAGLGFYKDFLTTFWDKFFPPVEKMRGREGAVRWLDERAGKIVADMPQSQESDREALTACTTALEAVAAVLSEKFTDQPIGLSELAEKISDKLNTIPAAEAAPSSDAPAADGSAPADGGSAPADGGYAQAAPAAVDSPDRVREAVLQGVDFLKKNNPVEALAYQLERALHWGNLAELPEPMPTGGDATLVPAWELALRKKEFQRVLDETEARLPADPLWLDLNLYAVRAMEGLGPTYEAARRGIEAQVTALVRRVPELPAATFEGGVAVASEVTRQWIDHELMRGGAKTAAGATADRFEETMGEARKLATRGKLPAATALVQKELLTVPPGRARFLWRLNLAKLCAESGRPVLAVPQLEALDGEAERGALELWEPELAVEVVKHLWQCYSSLSKTGGEAMVDKAARAYARLCRLDLTTAMALDGKK